MVLRQSHCVAMAFYNRDLFRNDYRYRMGTIDFVYINQVYYLLLG